MRIDFNSMSARRVRSMNGGTGEMTAKLYMGKYGKVIPCAIHAGGSIGMHTHETSDDINFVLSGIGMAVCDGREEPLEAGVCHICPKGESHSITNTGTEDLVLLTIVVER